MGNIGYNHTMSKPVKTLTIGELERLLTYISIQEVAQVTGSSPKAVRSWLDNGTAPGGLKSDRLGELNAVVQRAARLMKADFIRIWLCTSVPLLEDEKPIDLLARGEYTKVSQLVAGLESPGVI